METSAQRYRERRFAALYRMTYPDVLRFVQRRVGADRAEDVVHEAFLVAWRRFGDVPSRPQDARAWLFAVARNALLNEQRGQVRRDALGVRIATETVTSTQGDHDLVVHRADLQAAWKRLRPEDQEVLSLAVWEELPSPQAGQVLGISSAAYRRRLHRARSALRNLLASPTTVPVRRAECAVQE